MSDIKEGMLNSLVKDLNECLGILREHSKTDEAKVVVLSHIQGTLLSISSEAMVLATETANVIGAISNKAASIKAASIDDAVKGLLTAANDKSNKDQN